MGKKKVEKNEIVNSKRVKGEGLEEVWLKNCKDNKVCSVVHSPQSFLAVCHTWVSVTECVCVCVCVL